MPLIETGALQPDGVDDLGSVRITLLQRQEWRSETCVALLGDQQVYRERLAVDPLTRDVGQAIPPQVVGYGFAPRFAGAEVPRRCQGDLSPSNRLPLGVNHLPRESGQGLQEPFRAEPPGSPDGPSR